MNCASRIWLQIPGEDDGTWYYCEKSDNHDPRQAHGTLDGYYWFDTADKMK